MFLDQLIPMLYQIRAEHGNLRVHFPQSLDNFNRSEFVQVGQLEVVKTADEEKKVVLYQV